MGDVIYSASVFWILLVSPAGLFMLVIMVVGVNGFWQEFKLEKSQLTIANIFVRVYQFILGASQAMAMFIAYFVTGGYGVWQDVKVRKSKLNTPNIINGCLLLIISLALASSGILTLLGGEHIVKTHLDDKTIHYGKSTSYLVHTATGDRFHVSSNVYYQMQIGSCYSFTYYAAQGALALFGEDKLVTEITQITC